MEWKHLVYTLLYPITFEKNPLDGVERALGVTVDSNALDATPEDYLKAIRQAFESGEMLSQKFKFLLADAHSEESIRNYLNEIQVRLRKRVP